MKNCASAADSDRGNVRSERVEAGERQASIDRRSSPTWPSRASASATARQASGGAWLVAAGGVATGARRPAARRWDRGGIGGACAACVSSDAGSEFSVVAAPRSRRAACARAYRSPACARESRSGRRPARGCSVPDRRSPCGWPRPPRRARALIALIDSAAGRAPATAAAVVPAGCAARRPAADAHGSGRPRERPQAPARGPARRHGAWKIVMVIPRFAPPATWT